MGGGAWGWVLLGGGVVGVVDAFGALLIDAWISLFRIWYDFYGKRKEGF